MFDWKDDGGVVDAANYFKSIFTFFLCVCVCVCVRVFKVPTCLSQVNGSWWGDPIIAIPLPTFWSPLQLGQSSGSSDK